MASKTHLEPAPRDTHVSPDFVMYFSAKQAKAVEEVDGRPTIVVTASSDEIDLGNDRFALSALKQMQQVFGGMTIFLNHRYAVPEDVFGVVVSTKLEKREGFTDLDLVIAVEATSNRAMSAYQMIKNGVRLGVSVGVLVNDAEWQKSDADEDDRILEITDIVPLEASIVGIPANRRSWVHGARKAASLLLGDPDEDDDEDDDEEEDDMHTFHEDPRLLVAAGAEDPDGAYRDADPDVVKGVVGSHSPPVMDKGLAWSGSEAVGRMRKWASSDGSGGKDTIKWGKYKTGFTWFKSEDTESFGSYKMPHHDVVDGGLKTHFRGCAAAAVVMSGGRGGVSVPEGDMNGCKAHIARHYHQFDEKAPWERKSGEDWLDIEKEVAEELRELVRVFGEDETDFASFLEQIANAPIVDVTGEDDPPPPDVQKTKLLKGLREDYAADEFCDEVYSIFRAMYYSLFEIIASEDSASADKQRIISGLLGEFTDLVLEALGKTLDYLSEDRDAARTQLAVHDKATRWRLEAAEDLVRLTQSFEEVTAKHQELDQEHTTLVAQHTLQAQELDEARLLARDILGLVNQLMDLPLQRKIHPEQVINELAEKYPFLAPQIVAELASRRSG